MEPKRTPGCGYFIGLSSQVNIGKPIRLVICTETSCLPQNCGIHPGPAVTTCGELLLTVHGGDEIS